MRERREQGPLIGREAELARLRPMADDPAVGAVLLTGPPGVGKSRLADGLAAALAADGWRCVGLAATDGGARIPYAALSEFIPDTLASLGPDPSPADEREVLLALEAALGDTTAGDSRALGGVDGRAVVVVDDVSSVDLPSCQLLVHLATNRRIFLVATQAHHPGLPEALRRLTPADVVELAVEPLALAGTAALAGQLLGGPVGPGLSRSVHERARGNPFFVVELVHRAADDGDIAAVNGVFQLVGELTVGPSLGRQILFRLGLLSPEEREVLDVLATARELGAEDLAAVAGTETIEIMERRGLLMTWSSRRRLRAGLCHPLHADALRADMSPLVSRRRHGELVTLLERHGRRRTDDSVLHARASVAAGREVESTTLLEAAHNALRLDRIRDASDLAAAAFRSAPNEASRTTLAETLIRCGRFVEADDLLAGPLPADAGDWEVLRRAIRRSSNQLWGFTDPDTARRIDVDCLGQLTDADAIGRVVAHQAWIDYCDGAAVAAIATTDELLDTDHHDVRFAVCAARAPALVIHGRVDDGAELAKRAWDEGWGADTEYGSHGQHLIALGFGHLYQGDLPGARFVAELAIAYCRDNSETTPLLFFLELAAWTELLAGELETAVSYFEEALAISTELAIALAARSSLAGAAIGRAQLGQADEAKAAFDRIAEFPPMPGPRAGAEVAQAAAWAEVAVGHPARGAELLRSAAATTAEHRLSTLTLVLLLDVARLDYATAADVEGAEAALADTQGSLFPVVARAVRAAADRDPASLDEVADDFRQLGFTLWAAEFSARAADRWSADGDQRAATASQRTSASLRDQVGSVRTTALARIQAVEPLTRRQREIAALVADGRANADIAAQLHVSVRTVETHLRTIYRKVGVANRRELAALITAGELDDA